MDEKQSRSEPRDPAQLNAIERFYENFRKVPLKYLDIFIGLCAAALVLVFIFGFLNR